jgi:hypothetical protein
MTLQGVYGFSSSADPLLFRRIAVESQSREKGRNRGRGEQSTSLFFVEDVEIDLAELQQAPMPRMPHPISQTVHWLAVDGLQPGAAPAAAILDGSGARKKLRSGSGHPRAVSGSMIRGALGGEDSTAAAAAAAGAAGSGGPVGATLMPAVVQLPRQHTLSEELQIYFAKVGGGVLFFFSPSLCQCCTLQ